MEGLTAALNSLQLAVITTDQTSIGLEAVEQADLLTRIREAQREDTILIGLIKSEVSRYALARNGTILFRGRV